MTGVLKLVIEIGVEEMPAGVAPSMGEALKIALEQVLDNANVAPERFRLGVTPRRLLLVGTRCPVTQDDREEVVWGPPEHVAYDEKGNLTKAAEGFAQKAGVPLKEFTLEDKEMAKADT